VDAWSVPLAGAIINYSRADLFTNGLATRTASSGLLLDYSPSYPQQRNFLEFRPLYVS